MTSLKEKRNILRSSPEVRQAALAVLRPDVWARQLELKVDAKPFDTNGRQYIKAFLRDSSDEIVVKKAAQVGFTVAMIIKALHCVAERKWNGMYLLPFKQGTRTFVQSRVDPIIESSKDKELEGRFDVVSNVGHKQTADKINLYFRGTNIATDLREIPVDFEIWDERDKFVEEYLPDARARMDASSIGKLIQVSTPTAPGIGICLDENWEMSDQCMWEVPCPRCGRFQVLTFEDNVKLGDTYLDSILECSFCEKRITDRQRWEANTKGRWVPQYLDGRKRGYHVSQLNSPVKRFHPFIKPWFDGQTDAKILRAFYNLALGEPYAGHGDKFTIEMLDDCVQPGFNLRTLPTGPIFVGVDVGSVLHCKCSYLGRADKKYMWDARIFRSFNDLDKFLSGLYNFNCVIDASPEKSKAKELADKYKGRVWLGYEKDNPPQAEVAVFDEKKKTVSIDRTMAFDQLIAEYQRGTYVLPMNARELGEEMPKKDYNGFYAQHFEMVRVEKETSTGQTVFRWEKTRNRDHWHHAELFELVAFKKVPPLTVPVSVSHAFQAAGGLIG